ncbi:5-oxoprolinase subunit PxpB [Obesumbacterium proteus]|uniref:5-oxoprolinase subunit PxpB n=1 Tax=Obesumbacterium proteus TaxID=82983 RepID=UPI001F2EE1C1|nr:5-oxoprolinase subunit PxpB [Obesumbacterium proteus]MCE9884123.1 5-oxoprolinase subunit PxpB [Obesumbacterium proteus]MCE9914321.1 5-oxoprolinase subunit PxpB [Obesumbacterium proteus]MCE9929614.1 5-oxoprolinase subunit PxpB [Obesumbacterium proteus]MCG2876216.1 5-oxoprolinase subunit PxpB [Obesumbacterium proteus]
MQKARCYLLGERAAVLELEPPLSLESQKRIWSLTTRLREYPNVAEVIPGMNNITLLLSVPQADPVEALEKLQQWWEESESAQPEVRHIDIPVIYGGAEGPDLEEVARLHNLTARQTVELHSSAEYVVYFLGFQPGFGYLGGLPEVLHTPRRAVPRVKVPQGSVGIGGSHTGVYPLASPGGWQIIGNTPLALFDPQASSSTLLRPGDSVRFVPQKEGVC